MAQLPTGTLTFLLTDIEGSTQLLHHLGETYAQILREQTFPAWTIPKCTRYLDT